VGTFGTRVAGKNAIVCGQLKKLGITLYVDERKNGQLCLQIRQEKPLRWRLKSIVMGRTGRGDIVYEPDPECHQEQGRSTDSAQHFASLVQVVRTHFEGEGPNEWL
jgi:hypothetical protein